MKDFTSSARDAFKERVERDLGKVDWSMETHALRAGTFDDMVECSQRRSLCVKPNFPFDYPEELMEKRIRLAEEELQEMKDAHKAKSIVGIFDALVDQEVIHKGTVQELGFSAMFREGMKEVCAANYTKAREDGIYNINGVNTELLPEYPLGKFLKDKRFYHEPNLVKVMLEHASTIGSRKIIIADLLGENSGEITAPEGDLIRLSYTFPGKDKPHYVGVDIYNEKQSQEDWVNHVLTQLNYIQNVCKFDILGEERGYVNPDGTPTTNKTE